MQISRSRIPINIAWSLISPSHFPLHLYLPFPFVFSLPFPSTFNFLPPVPLCVCLCPCLSLSLSVSVSASVFVSFSLSVSVSSCLCMICQICANENTYFGWTIQKDHARTNIHRSCFSEEKWKNSAFSLHSSLICRTLKSN